MIKSLDVTNTYLVRFGTCSVLTSVTIILVTDTAYYCHWNAGNGNDTWEYKSDFHNNWTLIENITSFYGDKDN